MKIEWIYLIFILVISAASLLWNGFKKLSGRVFFSESNLLPVIMTGFGVYTQIRKLEFDFSDGTSWGYVLLFLLITLPFFFLSLRKKIVSVYGVTDHVLEKTLFDLFAQYGLSLKKEENGEMSRLVVGEEEASIEMNKGIISSKTSTVTFHRHRKIPQFELILEDFQAIISEKSTQSAKLIGLL
ncbi:MAG: hypothetical protein AB2421_18980, partial [Thermotaleaceae bacterium]